MAEIKFKQIEIPKENLIQNKTNKKWQEIRRASNIFASLVLLPLFIIISSISIL